MAGTMRKMAVYLGLVEDDRYDEYYDEFEDDTYAKDSPDEDARKSSRSYESSLDSARSSDTVRVSHQNGESLSEPATPARDWRTDTVVQAPVAAHPAGTRPTSRASRAKSVDPKRIITLHPTSYNDARKIGEEFRNGVPVVMNLTELDDGDAKRLVDFAAGLVFGLRGSIERVTNKVFMLTPADVEVGADDARIHLEREGMNAH